MVADGWAGANDSLPSPYTHKHTKIASLTRVFTLFISSVTDGPTDQETDKASYKVACTQLKMLIINGTMNPNDGNLGIRILILSLLVSTFDKKETNEVESGIKFLITLNWTNVHSQGHLRSSVIENGR